MIGFPATHCSVLGVDLLNFLQKLLDLFQEKRNYIDIDIFN